MDPRLLPEELTILKLTDDFVHICERNMVYFITILDKRVKRYAVDMRVQESDIRRALLNGTRVYQENKRTDYYFKDSVEYIIARVVIDYCNYHSKIK